MSAVQSCQPCCTTTPQTTETPGPEGPTGLSGVSAFTTTSLNFTVPALSGSVTITVADSTWALVGEAVAIFNGAGTADTFQITAIADSTHMTLTYLNYGTNTNAGGTIVAGSKVSPTGFQTPVTSPLPIANGGTAAATKANAQTNLGLGQDALVSTVTGLSQAVTATPTQVGACQITIPALGTYLFLGNCIVDWVGVTFAASRTVTAKIRNVTQATDLSTNTWQTQILTTTNLPSSSLVIPMVLNATVAVNDVIEVFISISVINSAGTFQVTAGNLTGIPLRKS